MINISQFVQSFICHTTHRDIVIAKYILVEMRLWGEIYIKYGAIKFGEAHFEVVCNKCCVINAAKKGTIVKDGQSTTTTYKQQQ